MAVKTIIEEDEHALIQKVSITLTDDEKDAELRIEIDNSQGLINVCRNDDIIGQCYDFGEFQKFLEKTLGFLKEAV